MLKTPESRERWLFWLVALLVLGAGLGLRDPWPADEPRFALVARQMVESHHWLFPMRGDELYSDKPPLFMWLQAAMLSLLGNLRVAFLLPSLVASLGTLWLVRDLGTRLFWRQAGTHAAWALLFALQFTFQARRAQIDPLLVFWVTLSMYGLTRHLLRGPDWRMWTLGWFAAGLGVITKGVGVIALLVLLPAAYAQWRHWKGIGATGWRDPRAWLGPLALFAPIALWLLPMLWSVHASADPALHDYAQDILLRQTAKRYADPWHHRQPPGYYLAVMATQWLPTMAALPWLWKPWRDALRQRDARVLLLPGWVALVVLFFSLTAGKREVYILPALPMLCVAMGPWLPALTERIGVRRLAFGVTSLITLAALAGGTLLVFAHPAFATRLDEARGIVGGARDLGWVALALGAGGITMLIHFGAQRAIAGLLGTLTVLWLLVGLVAQPLLNDASSARGLMQRAERAVPAGDELGLVAWKEQNLLMATRPVRTFGFKREAADQLRDATAWQRMQPDHRWLMLEQAAVLPCIERSRAVFVGHSNRREWWLAPASATSACP